MRLAPTEGVLGSSLSSDEEEEEDLDFDEERGLAASPASFSFESLGSLDSLDFFFNFIQFCLLETDLDISELPGNQFEIF